MKQVSANVFVETGFSRGCNPGFVVTPGGIVMVDSPYRPSDAVHWREEVCGRGEPLYLVNTEPHRDHITGDAFFDVTVIAHEGIHQEFLTSLGSPEEMRQAIEPIDPEGVALLENYQPNLPGITFNDRMTLHLGEQTLELICLPGHTLYETAVYLPQERVVFTGDNIFNGLQPFLHQAVPRQWLSSLDRIGELEVEYVVPGHGEIGSKEILAPMKDYLEEYITEVQSILKEELPRNQAVERLCQTENLYQRPLPPGVEAILPMLKQMMAEQMYDQIKAEG
jgi:cyclase